LKIGAARTRRSSPSIGASPSLATCTSRLVVLANVAAHLAVDRGNAGRLSHPLGSPPVSRFSPEKTTIVHRTIAF
jgi:hypothetical protein